MPKISHILDDIQIKHWIAKGEAVAKSVIGPRPPVRKRVMLQEEELRKLLSTRMSMQWSTAPRAIRYAAFRVVSSSHGCLT
jgi:hypothetical protein